MDDTLQFNLSLKLGYSSDEQIIQFSLSAAANLTTTISKINSPQTHVNRLEKVVDNSQVKQHNNLQIYHVVRQI